MKVAITGASGLIGSTLSKRLRQGSHEVVKVVRGAQAQAPDIAWDPVKGTIDSASLEGVDAVVHLAGESIAAKRWSAEQKKKIRDSRIDGTKLLSTTIASLSHPPKVFVSASAIGFYGDRGNEALTETSSSGTGFLADVCKEWETATQPAKDKGIRVVNVRTGVALSTKGGALQKMLPIFLLGGGGIIGDGNQYMSWLSLDDEIGAIEFALTNDSLSGPLNIVSPNPVTNKEFTRVMGEVLHRPTIFPLPAFAARIIMGEMADELLLSSQKVIPEKLTAAGYKFVYPGLKEALSHALQSS
jgi:uncharacterized protein (TIGR01777 family)